MVRTAENTQAARESDQPWWRDAVTYQVYVRSFADANGDGVGDLAGVRSRLGYLQDLGVDALWLNPFYPSPQADAGYDVADYRDVDPTFGTLAEVDGLIGDAHQRGLRVLVDLVPNHTSDQHAWFQAALAAGPGSRERARYLFRDGRGPGGAEPPNNWESNFGGPAWTRVTEPDGRLGQWYLHLFAPEQPDLDWTNEEVRAEFRSVLRFWLDRGVDGFRIDVAHGLAKDPEMPDLTGEYPASGPAPAGHPHWDQNAVHEVYRGWREVLDAYPGSPVFVAEAWVENPQRLARYLRPGELHTAFNFGFLLSPWDAKSLRAAIDESTEALDAVDAQPTWVLSNHDVVREVSRYARADNLHQVHSLDDLIGQPADDDLGAQRARAAALLMLALPGGAYLYQGEELGLPEVEDLPAECLQDPTWERSGHTKRGRDGCRVPIPWEGTESPHGFSPDNATTAPWLPQPASWARYSAAKLAQEPDSILALYRAALRIRREHPALGVGSLRWQPAPEGALIFTRDPGFTCVVNVVGEPIGLPAGGLLLASGPLTSARELPAATSAWLSTPSAP
jgi:alpha-glucosidase